MTDLLPTTPSEYTMTAPTMSYLECDIPANMTIADWRRAIASPPKARFRRLLPGPARRQARL